MEKQQWWLTVQPDFNRTYDVRVEEKTAYDAVAKYKEQNPGSRIIAVRPVARIQQPEE